MAYETKPNTGSLFKAKDRASEKHPEYTGTANIDGTEYRIAGWVNEASSGQKYFSFKFSPKDAKPEAKPAKPSIHEMESDIPF